MMLVVSIAPDKPAASANGTVSPSAIPITMSLTVSEPVKCRLQRGVLRLLGNLTKFVEILGRIISGNSVVLTESFQQHQPSEVSEFGEFELFNGNREFALELAFLQILGHKAQKKYQHKH